MKLTKIIRTIALLTMFSIVLASCSKKEEEPAPKPTNFFTVDGTEYSLSEGLTLEFGGDATTGYNFDLLVFSSGLDPDTSNESFTGEGELMYFELWSTSTTGLAAGTYTINPNSIPNACTSNFISINLNGSTGSSDTEYEGSAGTVTIAVDGSTYSIDFDLTVTGGKTLTGNYTGTLPNY
jgi:hypothetical protein